MCCLIILNLVWMYFALASVETVRVEDLYGSPSISARSPIVTTFRWEREEALKHVMKYEQKKQIEAQKMSSMALAAVNRRRQIVQVERKRGQFVTDLGGKREATHRYIEAERMVDQEIQNVNAARRLMEQTGKNVEKIGAINSNLQIAMQDFAMPLLNPHRLTTPVFRTRPSRKQSGSEMEVLGPAWKALARGKTSMQRKKHPAKKIWITPPERKTTVTEPQEPKQHMTGSEKVLGKSSAAKSHTRKRFTESVPIGKPKRPKQN